MFGLSPSALSDADVSVRVRAVRGLRTFGTETAAAWLADVLIADADPRVRLTALRAGLQRGKGDQVASAPRPGQARSIEHEVEESE